jgi:hypothetical protein
LLIVARREINGPHTSAAKLSDQAIWTEAAAFDPRLIAGAELHEGTFDFGTDTGADSLAVTREERNDFSTQFRIAGAASVQPGLAFVFRKLQSLVKDFFDLSPTAGVSHVSYDCGAAISR